MAAKAILILTQMKILAAIHEEIVMAARGIDLDEVKEISLKETMGRIESDVIRQALSSKWQRFHVRSGY